MANDPESSDEFGDDAEDHHVPAELLELHEVLEWQQALEAEGRAD